MNSQPQSLRRLKAIGRSLKHFERSVVNLIASDNAYPRFMELSSPYQGFTIQEGLRGRRPFAGAILHDQAEGLAVKLACDVFATGYANVQPHSCSQANQAV